MTAIQPKPSLLVCPPDYFEITRPASSFGAVNDYAHEGYKRYANDPKLFKSQARKQWDSLIDAFIQTGFEVLNLPPQENLPYLVFTADASCSFQAGSKGFSIISRFSNDHRSQESSIHQYYLQSALPKREIITPSFYYEGTGDTLYDPFRDLFWAGYTRTPGRQGAASGRSDIRGHELLAHLSQTPVISLEVQRPFFHLDTALAPLSRGHIVVFENGLAPVSFHKMLKEGFIDRSLDPKEYLITVDIKDAKDYACNLICHGNKVLLPRCSAELQKKISEKGYEVSCCDVDNFVLAGGGIHCLTNPINQRKSSPSYQL
jgi:N-dimethylarginine dimethylaminohydrolase